MKVDTLEKLYEDQMSSMRHGQEQFLALLPVLLRVTTHAQLRNSIRDLIPHLREQISRLERILPENHITRQANDSPGMKGLIGDGHAFLERASDADIIDAGLVTLFQRILHYSMAGYAALGTFAALLGREEEAQTLQRSLAEQAEAEEELVRIAAEVVNIDALSASTRSTQVSP